MFNHFLTLRWKENLRSPLWQKNIFLNILLIIFAIYFILNFLLIGIIAFYVINSKFSKHDPLLLVNSVLLYGFIADLIFRFLLQKLPSIKIKPFLTLPIKKSKIVHYILIKSSLSFFNIVSLFFYIPFAIVLIKEGYSIKGVIGWLATMIFITQSLNFINLLINKSQIILGVLVLTLLSVYLTHKFEIFYLANTVGEVLNYIYRNPIFAIAFLIILGILYYINFNQLQNDFYIDTTISNESKEVKSANLSFTNIFGNLSPFIKNDLRLIWRNKRTKSIIWVLFFGLAYGLIFYPQPIYAENYYLYIFIGIFSTGIFIFNFGQFIPAWDSSYFNFIMCQNFKFERYLSSKFRLLSLSAVILFILEMPYVYFGIEIIIINLICMIYNIGINTYLMLLGGIFNRKKINLDEKSTFNFKGTSAVHWLISFPIIILPISLFGLAKWLINKEIALALIAGIGIIGIVFNKKIIAYINKKYLAKKHIIIQSYNKIN